MIDRFVTYLTKEKRYSAHTATSYRNDLNSFKGYLEEHYPGIAIEKCTPPLVRAWLADMATNEYSPRSLRRKRTAVSSFYRYLIYIGIAQSNPTKGIPLPKLPGRLPVFADEKSINKIINTPADEDDYSSMRDHLMLELFYATGIRLSELIGIKNTDIDYGKCTLRIIGKRNKERIIPISAPLSAKMKAFELMTENIFEGTDTEQYFFLTNSGKKLYPKFVYRTIHGYLEDIASLSKKSPHVMRHTFATHLLQNGAELNSIKELLGHASLAATQVYTHTNIKQLREVYLKSHPKS